LITYEKHCLIDLLANLNFKNTKDNLDRYFFIGINIASEFNKNYIFVSIVVAKDCCIQKLLANCTWRNYIKRQRK